MGNLAGKTVLVTGGTGSFGRYVVHRLLSESVKEIRIFSRDEKKQFDMKHKFSDPRLTFHLGDVRDPRSVREVMCGVQVVFHAAALKQVPHCELFPIEAVSTNILGASNVIDTALAERVEAVVCISTDKAVQPVNVMGMTKALQERILAKAGSSPLNRGTRCVAVRYGNVLNSRGSVIPFFRSQIRQGKPLTITSPEMTRFLLTLNQAVDLVFHAYEHGRGGEIMVRKAASARVLDIAGAVAKMAGVEFKHTVIGVYPGEKIHEVLISEEERTRCEERGDYILINPWRQEPGRASAGFEYSSKDELMSLDAICELIRRSDEDAAQIDFEEGYFTK